MNWLLLKKEFSQPLENKIEFLVKVHLISSSISFYLFADCIEGSLWKVTYCEALCSTCLLQAVVYFFQMEISLTREINNSADDWSNFTPCRLHLPKIGDSEVTCDRGRSSCVHRWPSCVSICAAASGDFSMANLATAKAHAGVTILLFKVTLMILSAKFCWNKINGLAETCPLQLGRSCGVTTNRCSTKPAVKMQQDITAKGHKRYNKL